MHAAENSFGEINGQKVKAYTIMNDHGMEMTCINYGCTITKINVPDKNGLVENIVLGFDTLEEYETHSPYFGSIIGPVAGRISGSKFILDGCTYLLPKNEGNNHLHGGPQGFHRVIWDSFIEKNPDEIKIIFSYTSDNGEEGYPGNLKLNVSYRLTNNNELIISYEGTCDQKTIVDLTNHTYFNLSGNLKRNILEHDLTINSDKFLELNDELLPTGKLLAVDHTAFDFRKGNKLESGVKSRHPQNKLVGGGYDHPFLLNEQSQQEICLSDPVSGRKLIVETDKPSVIVYTSNMLEGDFQIRGKSPKKYLGICLETQSLPNAINQSEFPSIVLEEGETYYSETCYKFTFI